MIVFEKLLAAQYRRPAGLLGRYAGNRMARDHHPENTWTVALLQAQPADHVLELGFGAGVAVEQLAKVVTAGRIVGVDFSKTMVAAARRRNAQAVKTGLIDLRYGDVTSLPFGNDEFDKAFSIHSIYFWPQPVLALAEILRALKPAGMLALTILPNERMNASPEPGFTPYLGDELVALMFKAGFCDVRIASDAHPAHRSNFSVIGMKAN